MKKLVSIALIASAFAAGTVPAIAATDDTVPVKAEVQRGDMLYTADGKRVANVYRVNEQGDAQLIYRGKMITVSGDTLSQIEGKLTTSLDSNALKELR